MKLPRNFRKLTIKKRRDQLRTCFDLDKSIDEIEDFEKTLSMADSMIENGTGVFAVPLGFVPELIVNNKAYTIPMATEEPSVIAAASYGAAIINGQSLGLKAHGAKALMVEQIFLENYSKNSFETLKELEGEIRSLSNQVLTSMVKRGGGLEEIRFHIVNEKILKVELIVHVCDAMGANILNTLGETIGPWLAKKVQMNLLMAILSNSGEFRLSSAEFSLPVEGLAKGGRSGLEIAQRIVLASEVAQIDPNRAITNNKGIMNGIMAMVLATGNDTRAVESAAHFHASTSGKYTSLSQFTMEGTLLKGKIEIPIPAAIVGGAVLFHQTAKNNLKILDAQSVPEYSAVAASLGLIQNFAALFALVSEGIQKGHMRLHHKKKGAQ